MERRIVSGRRNRTISRAADTVQITAIDKRDEKLMVEGMGKIMLKSVGGGCAPRK
jgi:predicted secreted protein